MVAVDHLGDYWGLGMEQRNIIWEKASASRRLVSLDERRLAV